MVNVNTTLHNNLDFGFFDVIIPQNGGLFLSRGKGIHPRRKITSYEIIFVIRGELYINEGGINYTVHENQTLMLEPGIEHFGTKNYSKVLQYYWLHFSISNNGITYLDDQKISVEKLTSIIKIPRLKQLFSWYINDQNEKLLTTKAAKIIICQILSEIELSKNKESPFFLNPNYNAKKAYSIINTRFTEQISTNSIAVELHCNSDYLGRVFKKAYGLTIISYIKDIRIRYSQQLLLQNENNINEISNLCGFQSVSYFRKTFSSIVGCTPSQFRNSISKIHINTY